MVPREGPCFLEDHLAFRVKTGANTSKKFSLPSLLDGTLLSKVGSTLSKALLFTGSDRISIATAQNGKGLGSGNAIGILMAVICGRVGHL